MSEADYNSWLIIHGLYFVSSFICFWSLQKNMKETRYFQGKWSIIWSWEVTSWTLLLTNLFQMILRGFNIREYGSTLYVGLACAISPTNTNFRITFLLTRLQEALYEDLAV